MVRRVQDNRKWGLAAKIEGQRASTSMCKQAANSTLIQVAGGNLLISKNQELKETERETEINLNPKDSCKLNFDPS